MKKQMTASQLELAGKLKFQTKEYLESYAAKLEGRIQQIVARAESLLNNPRKLFLDEKRVALKTALEKYGKIDLVKIPSDKVILILARVQGEESILRKDILLLETEESEKDLKKQLDVARAVLAEKEKPGGRRQ